VDPKQEDEFVRLAASADWTTKDMDALDDPTHVIMGKYLGRQEYMRTFILEAF
jgi:hypothetical protein